MSFSVSNFFIDLSLLPNDIYGLFQLLFLTICYGFILMHASNMISDGSELLLLVPSVAGVVGSVVLPLLGKTMSFRLCSIVRLNYFHYLCYKN